MNYRHLSIEERSCIRKYYVDGLSYYLVKGNLKVLRRKGKSHGVKETRGKYSKGKSIRKRDKSVYSRQEAGHWEADTVVSGQGKSKACFATLAERKTRFYIAVKLPDKKAGTMENAIVSALSAFPCVCADTLGGGRWPVLPFDPISLVLAQRNGVEPPKKSAFEASTLPRWTHPPLPFGSKPQRDKLVRQVDLYTVGKLARQSQLDAVGCDVGASSPWERRAGPNSSRGGTLKRVSLGLHPVSLRKSKEMGWNGQ